ncbi:transposase IS4 family protein [Dietzia sp. DQ12-45-1b]|nr:transposase IS4 family protein [Dietzia sp. DQ12-45-1b]
MCGSGLGTDDRARCGRHDRGHPQRKENAAPTYKHTFGYHPIGLWCDNTEEFLAASLHPGNAGSNTAADHIDVLAQAIAQIPAAHRRDLLIRSEGAGAFHALLD